MWRVAFHLALIVIATLGATSPVSAGSDNKSPSRQHYAVVCFYRETAFHGNWFRYRVFDGNRRIGTLGAGTFFTYLATPGEHVFRTRLASGASTMLPLEAGRVYYLRCDPDAEVLYRRPRLGLVSPIEGAAVTAELLERTALHPEDRLVFRPTPLTGTSLR